MSEENKDRRNGRRALFDGTVPQKTQAPGLSHSEISSIITTICAGGETDEESSLLFSPIITKISELHRRSESCNEECKSLTSKLLSAEEMIARLKDETSQLGLERESYLNDLITSHTEFDRALEIFQYHEVPMVLTGPERTVHDVNDAFCSLFSIARSEITTAHPPLDTYFPDITRITGPDNKDYQVITLSPPVVPFDHEALSLVLLIPAEKIPADIPELPAVHQEESGIGMREYNPDITSIAFEQFPIPAVIINQYRTIVRCNQEFCRAVGRDKDTLYLRDIGSSGIRFDISECIDETLGERTTHQCTTTITLPDGTESDIFLEMIPLARNDNEPEILIVAVEMGGEIPAAPADETGGEPESDNEDFIRLLIDLNPSATALLDSHARVVLSNEGFGELTGLSPADLAGTDVRDLGIPLPDSVLTAGATDAVYLPQTITMESAWGTQELSGMIMPVRSPQSETAAILVLQPVESTAPALQPQSPDQIIQQTPFNPDSIPVPFLSTDLSGAIIRTNKAFVELMNRPLDEIVGQQRESITSSIGDTDTLVRISDSSRITREYSGTAHDDGSHDFWFCDISTEKQIIRTLEEKISILEKKISEIGQQNQQVQSLFSTEKTTELIDIVEFELNEERYAIDISMVREVVEMLPVTPLPRTPPYVIGIINLRGEVTHIIDLAILLGERPKKNREGQKIIIIPSDVTRGEHVGIIVDNVQSVTEIQGRHVSLLGDNITTQIKTHIKGIIKISHDDVLDKHTETSREAMLVIWLDIQKILDDIQGAL